VTLSVLLLVLVGVLAALVVIIIVLCYKLWTRCRERRVRDKAAEQQRRRLLASINALPRGKYQRCEVCPSPPPPSLVLAPLDSPLPLAVTALLAVQACDFCAVCTRAPQSLT
jgi:hypothetical protein